MGLKSRESTSGTRDVDTGIGENRLSSSWKAAEDENESSRTQNATDRTCSKIEEIQTIKKSVDTGHHNRVNNDEEKYQK